MNKTNCSFGLIILFLFTMQKYSLLRGSYVSPLQIPCKSHFSPIPRNGPETDLKRTWNGGGY